MDPFAGSAVTGTAATSSGYGFVGIEAHPLIAELGQLKLGAPPGLPDGLSEKARILVKAATTLLETGPLPIDQDVDLTTRCFKSETLQELIALRSLIVSGQAEEWSLYAKWALLGTLRDVAAVKVGWPYLRPNEERQPRYSNALARFAARANMMAGDLAKTTGSTPAARGEIRQGDSRDIKLWAGLANKVHGCISSPPYLNNFDYADATRLELYFWGDVTSWAEMVTNVRSGMLTATTQQSSIGEASDALDELKTYGPVHEHIKSHVEALRAERARRKRGKEYDRVVPAYFAAIGKVLDNLAGALAPGSSAVWLIGDSAPYGVHVNTPALIGALAEQVGFKVHDDVPLRRRGQRWASNNTRHNVDLSERLLLLRRQ